jgi:hypothetical protein
MKDAVYRAICEKTLLTAGPISYSKRRAVSGEATEDYEIARDGCVATRNTPPDS